MHSNRTSLIWTAAALLLFATPAHADIPNEPPSVSITSPTDGQMFDGPTATIDVVLEAFGGDEGIDSIRLLVDDTPVLIDNDEPWSFEAVEIDEGMHTLVAVAVSASNGAEYPSEAVEIVVLAAAGSETSDSGTSGGDAGTSVEPKKGCSVAQGTQWSAALVLLGLLGLPYAIRRRED